MSKHIKHVRAISTSEADGLVAQVYDQMKRDLGVTPEPLTLHAPAPEILAGVWSVFRESLIAGNVRRGVKETVAATISDLNRCPWCVDAHTMVLHATGDHEVAHVIVHRQNDRDLDPKMQSVVAWAQATRSPNAEILAAPPFSSQNAAEFIGTAVVFHYLNRMVNVMLSETFLPSNELVKTVFKRVAGWLYSRTAHSSRSPGQSLELVPEAPLPEELAWAAPNPTIADAFAGFASIVEAAGREALPAEVRSLVEERIGAWDGDDLSLSRHWVEEAITELDDASKPAARLALLTALASYQVDEITVQAFRDQQPADESLIGALAWASFTAARKIGTWLSAPIRVAREN